MTSFRKTLQILDKRTERQSRYTVSVNVKPSTSNVDSPLQTKRTSQVQQVNVQVTKEDDMLYLYGSQITEKDYQQIKARENLAIDFLQFPNYLMNLLESVVQEEDKPEPKYHLRLSENESSACTSSGRRYATLQVVEANGFKYIFHLSLQLISADEKHLLLHLVESVTNLKKANFGLEKTKTGLQKEIYIINKKLQQCETTEASKEKELESLREQLESLREEHSRTMEDLKAELEAERKRVHEADAAEQSEQERVIQELRDENTQLRDELMVETTRRRSEEDENAKLQNHIAELRREYDSLRDEWEDTEEKMEQFTQLETRYKNLSDYSKTMKESLIEKTGRVDRLQRNCDALKEENAKLADICKTFEESSKQKTRTLQSLLAKVEKELRHREEELKTLSETNVRLNAELNEITKQYNSLRSSANLDDRRTLPNRTELKRHELVDPTAQYGAPSVAHR